MAKSKTFARTTNVEHLKMLVLEYGLRNTAAAFGVHVGTVSKWIGNGEAPKWTHLAAEALNRRKAQKSHYLVAVAIEQDSEECKLLMGLLTLLKVEAHVLDLKV